MPASRRTALKLMGGAAAASAFGAAPPRPIRSRSASRRPSPVPTPPLARRCSAARSSPWTEINAAGGVLGRQLALVIRDNEHKLDRGVAQTRELIEREGCAAILGSQGSFIGLAVIDTIHELKVPWFALAVGGVGIIENKRTAELHVPRRHQRPRGRQVPGQLRAGQGRRQEVRDPQRGHAAGACRPSPTCRPRSRSATSSPPRPTR